MAICSRCKRKIAQEVATETAAWEILDEICRRYSVTREQLTSRNREQHVVAARHEGYYQLRRQLKWTWQRVGKIFNRDHSTCVYGARVFADFNELEITE